ncbi:MAG: hypothetical protein ACOYN6_00165 [Ignavibacteria bacterium]
MNSLIDILKRFNTKERFYLIGQALGNSNFEMSADFKKIINETLDLNIPNDNVFVALDYHLDWIYGSLVLNSENINPSGNELFARYDHNEKQMIYGTQEDSDLLICYNENGIYHLIFIEAKGVMPWSIAQLVSKTIRLKDLFGDDGIKWKGVQPHFLLISPNDLPSLESSIFPNWALIDGQPAKLRLAIQQDLIKITRCNSSKKDDHKGEYWKIDTIQKDKRQANKLKRISYERSDVNDRVIESNSTTIRWTNIMAEKYSVNHNNIYTTFPQAFKYLDDIARLQHYGFHMGTGVNMHYYYQEHFLFYFKFQAGSDSPIVFSSKYNLQLKHDAKLNTPVMFFKPLIEKLHTSDVFGKGKVELITRLSDSNIEINDIYVYPFEDSSIFFNCCREVLSEIANVEISELFP